MSLSFSRGIFKLKNPEKYLGNRAPVYRSSWEFTFMSFCDNNPAVQEWANESVKIPYRDPLTGKSTVYVPDFLISYIDKNQKKHVELIEIKPANQMLREKVGKNPYNQAQYVKNIAKWAAAGAWCRNKGIRFRVINESDIFHTGSKRR
jgi:hypothetical protein